MLKMPRYSCKWVLREKLRYACYFCNSINLDDYSHVPAAAATYGGLFIPSTPRTPLNGTAARLSIPGVAELPTGIDDEVSPSDSEYEQGGSPSQAANPNQSNSGAIAARAPNTDRFSIANRPTFRSVEIATRQEYGSPKAEARRGTDLNAGTAAGGEARVAGGASNSHAEILEDSQHLLRMLSEMSALMTDTHSNHDDQPPTPPFFHSPPRVRSPSPFVNPFRPLTFRPPPPPNLLSLAGSRPTPVSSDSTHSGQYLQQIGGPPVLPPHSLLTASDRERLNAPNERFFRVTDRSSVPSPYASLSVPRPLRRERAPIDSDDDLNF